MRTWNPHSSRTHGGACPAACLLLALVVSAVSLGGCGGRYGEIRWDTAARQTFSSSQVLPGHKYYTSGSELMPDAILAVVERHPLRTKFWHEVAMTPELLRRLQDNMRGTRADGPYGYAVLDDRGERIGLWCSYLKPGAVIMLEDGGVDIPTPVKDQETLRLFEKSQTEGAGRVVGLASAPR